jgi:hypothetical protein
MKNWKQKNLHDCINMKSRKQNEVTGDTCTAGPTSMKPTAATTMTGFYKQPHSEVHDCSTFIEV